MVCENIALGLPGIIQCIGSGLFSNNETLFLLAMYIGIAGLMFALRIPLRFAFGLGFILSILFMPFGGEVFWQIFFVGVVLIGYFIIRGVLSAFKEV